MEKKHGKFYKVSHPKVTDGLKLLIGFLCVFYSLHNGEESSSNWFQYQISIIVLPAKRLKPIPTRLIPGILGCQVSKEGG